MAEKDARVRKAKVAVAGQKNISYLPDNINLLVHGKVLWGLELELAWMALDEGTSQRDLERDGQEQAYEGAPAYSPEQELVQRAETWLAEEESKPWDAGEALKAAYVQEP